MLNEERVILMTKLASYEEHEGEKNLEIGNYFRGDYIAIQVVKSLLGVTVAFAIGFALYILYDFEGFMQEFYKMDLISFAKSTLMYYGLVVVVYGFISYEVYSYRYTKAKKSLKRYYNNLKKLNTMYREQ